MDAKDSFHFCLGPLVFRGRLGDDGTVMSAQADLGPFGSNLDWAKGLSYDEDTKRRMIEEGYIRVEQYSADYRRHAAKMGFPLFPKSSET